MSRVDFTKCHERSHQGTVVALILCSDPAMVLGFRHVDGIGTPGTEAAITVFYGQTSQNVIVYNGRSASLLNYAILAFQLHLVA